MPLEEIIRKARAKAGKIVVVGMAGLIVATSILGGSGKAMAVDPAQPSLQVYVDAADRAAGVQAIIENSPAPIGYVEAKVTYDGTCANVTGPVREEDFSVESQVVDNVNAVTTFTGVSAEGVASPAKLGFLTVRVFGNDTQQCPLSLEILALKDTAGNNLPVSPANVSMSFMRGDAKADGTVNIADVLFMAQYLTNLRPLCGTEIDLSCVQPVNAASVKFGIPSSDRLGVGDVLLTAQRLADLRNELYNGSVPQPLYFNINNEGILSTLIYDYSGLFKLIVDRLYYEQTGRTVDNEIAEGRLEIVVQNDLTLPIGQYAPKPNPADGGTVYINRTGIRHDLAMGVTHKELHGGYERVTYDFLLVDLPPLATNSWGEGTSAAKAATAAAYARENHGYTILMKDTEQNRTILAIIPYSWDVGDPDPAEEGLMSVWYEVISDPDLAAEVMANKYLTQESAQTLYLRMLLERDPATYDGKLGFTELVKEQTSAVMVTRVSPDSNRIFPNATSDLNRP